MHNTFLPNDQNTALKIIDIEVGSKMIGSDHEKAVEMVGLLVESLKQDLPALQAAFDAHNLEQLENLIHRIYGGTCYCGVPRLTAVLRDLYAAVREKKEEKISVLFAASYREIEALTQQYYSTYLPVSSAHSASENLPRL